MKVASRFMRPVSIQPDCPDSPKSECRPSVGEIDLSYKCHLAVRAFRIESPTPGQRSGPPCEAEFISAGNRTSLHDDPDVWAGLRTRSQCPLTSAGIKASGDVERSHDSSNDSAKITLVDALIFRMTNMTTASETRAKCMVQRAPLPLQKKGADCETVGVTALCSAPPRHAGIRTPSEAAPRRPRSPADCVPVRSCASERPALTRARLHDFALVALQHRRVECISTTRRSRCSIATLPFDRAADVRCRQKDHPGERQR
jgi:hypothetical protein